MLDIAYLSDLAASHREFLTAKVAEFDLAGRVFSFNSRPAIMGVVNLSPDSWYRESVCLSAESAIRRGTVLSAQGADIIDVGAESTLAHASRAEAAAQSGRLVPVIQGLCDAGCLVSVETYHPQVARSCLEAGARVLNLTGTESNDALFRPVADHEAAVIICHVQGKNVRDVKDFDFSTDPMTQMRDYFSRQIELATSLGVKRIFIDPGLGFYYRNLQDSTERVRHQMKVFLNTFRLRALGWPVCHALPHAFEFFGEEVRCAEPFFAVLASLGKTDLFRTHEVPRTKAVLDTLAAFQR